MNTLRPFEYDMAAVRDAGQVVGGDLTWTPETEQRIREAFSIANQWRDSHAHPMRSLHHTLRAHIRLRGLDGLTAARLKRMNAIRGKLRRMSGRKRPLGLETFQDLGGCRAIMGSMQDATALISTLRDRSRHILWGQDDYIREARQTGYRSHHLKFEYRGSGDKQVFNGRRIEVQIRTDLQHSWATAVEAVGLFRGEELKSGKGSPEWLRLFALMSAEFAEIEGCDPAKGMPDRSIRMRELKELTGELGAVQALENMSTAFFWSLDAIETLGTPKYYLIEYEHETRQVKVTPKFQSRFAVQSYEDAEVLDNLTGRDTSDVVLIEGVKLENLKRAYPNYFGDVQLFKMQLGELVSGGTVKEFQVALQKRSIPTPRERADASWMFARKLWAEPTPSSKLKKKKKRK